MVSFAGYSLPVQYEIGVIAEHKAVRKRAGLFDVSHMGEFLLTGKDALKNLQGIFTNDFANMRNGRVRYTLLCNETGGILDDLVVCKMDKDRYMLVVNAANREKDSIWIQQHMEGDCVFEDISDSTALIALQGPLSETILKSVSPAVPEKYYTLIEKGDVGGLGCIISRTGYTGEDGFEIYCKNEDALRIWSKLLLAGKEIPLQADEKPQAEPALVPCGLGARDTLRLEASMPLYGNEMDETVTPFEAGLSFAVKMDKPDFVGKSALEGKTEPTRIRTGMEITDRAIVRKKSPVFFEGKPIGQTTSGTFCPSLGKAYAMALLDVNAAQIGTVVEAEVKDKMISAVTCDMPFYKKS